MDRKTLILKENLWQVMMKLSWPAVIAMILYGGNTLLDAFFVGRFVGENALAGVSLAYPLTQVALGFGSLIGVGAGSALSIALGKKDLALQKRILGTVHYLTIIVCVVYGVLAYAFAGSLIRMMGGSGLALEQGIVYFRITIIGTVFWVLGLAYNMIIRAEGKMTTAARIMAYGLLVNAIFNYLFIVVLDLGVSGAAWGTNIGMLVYTIAGGLYFTGKASFEAKLLAFSRHPETVKSILSMGMPSFIMTVMSLLQAIVVFNALSRYGTVTDVAFFGVSYRLFMFALTPIFGLMRALQPVIGINYGASQYDRVVSSYKIFTIAAMVLTVPIWLIMVVSAPQLLQGMMPEIVLNSDLLLSFRVFISVLPLMPIVFMGLTFFPSIDKSKPASIIGISRQVVFYIPIMMILPRIWGVKWVYFGSMIIDVVMALAVVFLVKREFDVLKSKMRKVA